MTKKMQYEIYILHLNAYSNSVEVNNHQRGISAITIQYNIK